MSVRALSPRRFDSPASTEPNINLEAEPDPLALALQVLETLAEDMGVDSATLVMLQEPGGAVFVAARLRRGSVSSLDAAAAPAFLDQPIVAQTLQFGSGMLLADLAYDRRRHLTPDYRSGSLLVWPIRHQERPIGVLLAHHALPHAFGEAEQRRIAALLYCAGNALRAALRLRQESLYRDQSLALLTLSQTLSSEQSPIDLAGVVQHTGAVFQATYSLLFLAEGERAILPVTLPAVLSQPSAAEALQRITMLATQAWRTRTALKLRGKPELGGFHSIALPLVHAGTSWGALILISSDAGVMRYAPGTWSLLTIMTQMLALACANLLQQADSRGQEETVKALDTIESLLQQQAVLQRSRDLVRTVFDSVPDGMLLLDSDQRVLAANQAFCQNILGAHPRTVVGKRYEVVWHDILSHSEVFLAPQALHVRYDGPKGPAWYTIERSATPARDGEEGRFVEVWREVVAQEVI